MFDITALGEILIDFTYQGKNEDGQKLFAQNPGGAPPNALTAASRLGAKCAFLGKAGEDMHGRFLKDVLRQEGINTDGFLLDPQVFTTLAFVELSPEGERSFSFARKPGADTQISRAELKPEILKESKIFHVGSLSLTDEPARDATVYAVKTAKENGAIISYDPNYRASLWTCEEAAKEQMRSLIPYVDIMKISDEETALLTDFAEPEKAAAALGRQGVTLAVVTLGAEGAYVSKDGKGLLVPGFKSSAVDTTGAGDSFWGGFLYQVCRSGKRPEEISLEEAAEFAKFANGVASLCVERRGGIPAMPELSEVMERIANK